MQDVDVYSKVISEIRVKFSYMTFGGSTFGGAVFGGTAEPDDFEELSDKEKDEMYRNLYQEFQEYRSEFDEFKEENKRHRKYTWAWRFGSFVAGTITGATFAIIL